MMHKPSLLLLALLLPAAAAALALSPGSHQLRHRGTNFARRTALVQPPVMVAALGKVKAAVEGCTKVVKKASEAMPLATPTAAFAVGTVVGVLAAPSVLGMFAHYNTVDDVPNDLFKANAKISAKVVKVSDGDTFRVRHTGGVLPTMPRHLSKAEGGSKKLSESTLQIRIAAVDCPETAKFGSSGQAFGDEATRFVEDTIGGKKVTIKLLARDQYQRAVSTVTYRGGPLGMVKKDLSEELLKLGLAQVYRQGGAQYDGSIDRWDKLESKAQQQKVGIWKGGKKAVDPAAYKKALKAQQDK